MQDGAGVLVFQSCSTENFKECQDPSGLNLEQSKIVIKHMAEFHAISRAFVVKHGVTGVKRRYPMLAQVIYLLCTSVPLLPISGFVLKEKFQ